MASEPSSATITSEPSTSTSEIQTYTSEPSQLEVLALNYLRNQEISNYPQQNPKLNPCSICQRKYIMRAETESLTCPSCNIIIELTREEAALASGKYHLQKKQTDTGQGDEELMASLGLVEDESRAGQGSQSKQVTMQDHSRLLYISRTPEKYAGRFENRVRDIRSQDSTVTDPTARGQVYREVTQHLPGITESNLRK
ncbi:10195_t:CDS:2 [Funneliformis geosporum]|nr:10195_t:CDS:2 [Funneliformis geosporum]